MGWRGESCARQILTTYRAIDKNQTAIVNSMPMICPTHQYKGGDMPTRSCPTCWGIFILTCTERSSLDKAWISINRKGMKKSVIQSFHNLLSTKYRT